MVLTSVIGLTLQTGWLLPRGLDRSVIATTDGNTNFLAKYAYTPYGRAWGKQTARQIGLWALAQNPYRFVCSRGSLEEVPDVYFMRARYYSAELGVFLSTDPVKHIGPGWKTRVFTYANNNL